MHTPRKARVNLLPNQPSLPEKGGTGASTVEQALFIFDAAEQREQGKKNEKKRLMIHIPFCQDVRDVRSILFLP